MQKSGKSKSSAEQGFDSDMTIDSLYVRNSPVVHESRLNSAQSATNPVIRSRTYRSILTLSKTSILTRT